MTDTAPPEPATDQYGRPLGGQLERDARLLAAAQAVDLTEGSCDNTTREYWYDRARETYALLRQYGRGDDVDASENQRLREQLVAQKQVLVIVRAQNDAVVEKVDAALGHRYHTPGVHHSIPAVAEKAATELKQMQARLDAITETLGRAAAMMTSDSRDWSLDRSDVWLYGLLVDWGCEELHEHDEVCGGDGALCEVALQHAWSVDDVLRIRRFRAALQGDQPADEPAIGTNPLDPRCDCPPATCVPEAGRSCRIWHADDEPDAHEHVIPSAAYSCPICSPLLNEAEVLPDELDDQPTGEADRG